MSVPHLRRYWHAVAWSRAIGETPAATVLLGQPLVLWRHDVEGVIAMADRCPHRGTALSLGTVEDGCLTCPYHGWTYDGSGRCVGIPQQPVGTAIPPRAVVERFRCTERYGLVWVALDEPTSGIPLFPEWDDPSYRHVECPPYTWDASAERMVENFTDFGHLGYLHDGYLGERSNLVVPGHTVSDRGDALHYEITMTVPNTNDEFTVTDLAGERATQTNTYVLTLPYTIHLQCTYRETGRHRTLYFVAQPLTESRSTGYCFQSRDFDLDGDDQPYADFQELLAEQDRPIVESQRPTQLPLGLTSELHLPFDRVAIAYRRALTRIFESP